MATPTKAVFMPYNWVTDGDAVVFSGGSWETTLPLSRLASYDPRKRAWSTDALNASTIVKIDLGQIRTLNFFAAMFTNFSQSARVRWTFGNDATFATWEYQTAWLPAYPVNQEFGAQAFGVFSFGGFQAVDASDPRGVSSYHFTGYAYAARYLMLEVDDETNSDARVKLGIVYAAYGEEASIQIRDGFGVELDEAVIKDRALSGALLVDPLYKTQRVAFELQWLPIDEMLCTWYEMFAQRGKSKPILFFLLPDDSLHLDRLGLYGIVTDAVRIVQTRNRRFGTTATLESI